MRGARRIVPAALSFCHIRGAPKRDPDPARTNPPAHMTSISIRNVTKRFGDTAAIDGVSLEFAPGSFNALLGASGCGKTTLLRLIAGFEHPDAGEILFDEQPVARPARQVPPEKRGVGVVFQSYALWPHKSVAENIAYPLETRGLAKGEIATRVADVLDLVGLRGFDRRSVHELSGGQRQRVALARCVVARTRVILFDEPLANLDMHLRASMLDMFRDIHARTEATIIYVTHDQSEALALADRVAVMNRGHVLQFAAPEEVYRAPADRTVASFVGRGSIVSASAIGANGALRAQVGDVEIPVRGDAAAGSSIRVLLRPEHLTIGTRGAAAEIVSSTYKGASHEVRARLLSTGEDVLLELPAAARPGAAVFVSAHDGWIIPGGD